MKKPNGLSLLFLIMFCLVLLLPAVSRTSAAETAPNCAELLKGKCLLCHHETRICRKIRQDKGKGSWKRTIKSMIRHGAAVNKKEQDQLVNCLSKPDIEIKKLCE